MSDKPKIKCSVEGCRNTATTKGLCPKHYQRQRLHGDAEAPSRREKLTPTEVANIRKTKHYRGVHAALARKYGVTESTISSIRRGDRRAAKA